MDSEGIIHLRTKIRTELGDFGISAILPSSHPVVMLVLWAQKRCVMSECGDSSLLRGVLDTRRQENHPRHSHRMLRAGDMVLDISTIPPALPEPRVWDAAVFETTGFDMAGLN
jgi:hypothetical protein